MTNPLHKLFQNLLKLLYCFIYLFIFNSYIASLHHRLSSLCQPVIIFLQLVKYMFLFYVCREFFINVQLSPSCQPIIVIQACSFPWEWSQLQSTGQLHNRIDFHDQGINLTSALCAGATAMERGLAIRSRRVPFQSCIKLMQPRLPSNFPRSQKSLDKEVR